jgi:hypothetical protein
LNAVTVEGMLLHKVPEFERALPEAVSNDRLDIQEMISSSPVPMELRRHHNTVKTLSRREKQA